MDAALSAIQRCKCSNNDDHVQSDSVYADFNVFTAIEPLEEFDEMQVEDAMAPRLVRRHLSNRSLIRLLRCVANPRRARSYRKTELMI